MKQRNLASLLLAGAMTAALLTGPAQAAESPSPQEIAAAHLQAEGLMNGDEHGDLHLDKGLTRAELACLISPIVLNPEHVAWERDYYAKLCTTNFSDVPEWAQVAVGVCASIMSNGLCLTQNILEFHNQGNGCSLSAILIPDAPGKYFLSSEMVEKLLYKSLEGRRDTGSTTRKE